MVGQSKLKAQIGRLLQDDNFPRFSIFIGEQGSGRKTIIRSMLKGLGTCQECAIDVDTVREVIDEAYRQVSPVVYVFADADNMSVAAKNALLKVTEEPPNNAYFVMTLIMGDNTLPTIKSRASLFYMDTYTTKEILEYYHNKTLDSDDEIIEKCCNVPGDVDLLCGYDVNKFYEFIQTVVDNVAVVSGANSFKIGSRLCLSGDDKDKYDLVLFFKSFRAECLDRLSSDPLKYIAGIGTTSDYLRESMIAGINKQMIFDAWLLDIRKAWL